MALEHDLDTPLACAVRAAGSQRKFGRLIGRAQSTVNDMLRLGHQVPAEEALLVERETGVPKEKLRPDIYPPSLAAPHGGIPAVSAAPAPVACDRQPISQDAGA